MKLPQLPLDWFSLLSEYNIEAILGNVENSLPKSDTIFPPSEEIFTAFQKTPVSRVKVILIGQDPYHTPGVAHGLSFSVKQGKRIPPSLRIIFEELQTDLQISKPEHGCLISWAKEGVLLLNTVLTVSQGKANSHKNLGWEKFTDMVINELSKRKENLVFILWGKNASEKKKIISPNNHLIIESSHPAAEIYSGGRAGFYGHRPFSRTNSFLKENGISTIDWRV
jgi:uracil-DNA glycosylase